MNPAPIVQLTSCARLLEPVPNLGDDIGRKVHHRPLERSGARRGRRPSPDDCSGARDCRADKKCGFFINLILPENLFPPVSWRIEFYWCRFCGWKGALVLRQRRARGAAGAPRRHTRGVASRGVASRGGRAAAPRSLPCPTSGRDAAPGRGPQAAPLPERGLSGGSAKTFNEPMNLAERARLGFPVSPRPILDQLRRQGLSPLV